MRKRLLSLITLIKINLALFKARVIDVLFGVETGGVIRKPRILSLEPQENDYVPTYYGLFNKIVKVVHLRQEDVVVDLGCGKGRALLFFARYNIKKVIGVEVDRSLAEAARKNVRSFRGKIAAPIEIVHMNAEAFDPFEGTIFYLFNPFCRATVERVIQNIGASLRLQPRTVRIIYYVPAHRDVLSAQPWLRSEGCIRNRDCEMWVSV